MAQARKRSQKEKKAAEMPVLNANAAGIDIGATEIYVAVHPDSDPEPVRSFATFTQDLHQVADWLTVCKVSSVAMESTGVYWIPLFQILEERGFQVCLVNARYYQNVPGRRTDVSDCQWLRHLHSVGLLRPSFRPAGQVCVLRSLVRHRDSLIQDAASHVLRMQKALNQMNLQIHHVISDITGECKAKGCWGRGNLLKRCDRVPRRKNGWIRLFRWRRSARTSARDRSRTDRLNKL